MDLRGVDGVAAVVAGPVGDESDQGLAGAVGQIRPQAVNDPAVPQKDKEQLYLKLKTLGQLVPKYTSAYENSLYNLGYIYSKRGESERARKYLTEYLQTTQFSTNRDSKWMKAKTLLLELYSLEGEF